MNILIVDDELNELKPTEKKIRRKGHNVLSSIGNLMEAYRFLINPSNKWKVDLLLVDEDFQYNPSPNTPFDDGGAKLCKVLALECPWLPIIMITGKRYTVDKAVEVLGDYDCCYMYEKTDFGTRIEDKGFEEIINLPSFKRIWTIRQYEIEKSLKIFFKNLSDKQLKAFEDECNKGLTADWTKPELSIELEGGKYTALELLFDPFSVVDLGKINEQIFEFIQDCKITVIFSEAWRKEKVQTLLNKYFDSENYNKIKNEIDLKALHFLTNILLIFEDMEVAESDNEYYSLNNYNILNYVTTSFKGRSDEEDFEILVDKLVARRVVFGFQKIISGQFQNSASLDKTKLSLLLQNGHSNPNLTTRGAAHRKKDSNFTPKLFTNDLGLVSKDNKQFKGEKGNHMLREEIQWVENYALKVKNILKFLRSVESEARITKMAQFNPTDLQSLNVYIQDNLSILEKNWTMISKSLHTLNSNEQKLVMELLTLYNP